MEHRILLTDSVQCAPEWSWVSARNGWTGYHLWHVTKGGATIQKGAQTFFLVPGDCFFFNLQDNHLCAHNPLQPLHVETVYWQCSETLSPALFHVRGNHALCAAIHQCVQLHQSNQPHAAALWLAAAVSAFTMPAPSKHGLHNPKIDALCTWMVAHCTAPFSLNSLCKMAGYSRNHVIRLFRQQTGFTPQQYLMRCRIRKSISLLLYTNDTVTDIALAVGFEDISYFSRSFKQMVGVTPTQIRMGVGEAQLL